MFWYAIQLRYAMMERRTGTTSMNGAFRIFTRSSSVGERKAVGGSADERLALARRHIAVQRGAARPHRGAVMVTSPNTRRTVRKTAERQLSYPL